MSLLCRRVCRVCRACSRCSCSTAGTRNSAGCLAACNLGGRHSHLNSVRYFNYVCDNRCEMVYFMMRRKLLHRMKEVCGATSRMMKDELIVGEIQVDRTRFFIYICDRTWEKGPLRAQYDFSVEAFVVYLT